MSKISGYYSRIKTKLLFQGNRVNFKTFRTKGVPYIKSRGTGTISIGENFAMNNGLAGSFIGYDVPCAFIVENGCRIVIGNNVGMSQTTLVAHANIIIGDDVKIGSGTRIFTSDFHSLQSEIRRSNRDKEERKVGDVTIGNDVFIGTGSIIPSATKA